MRNDWEYGLSTDPGIYKPINEDRCFLRLGEKRRPGRRAILAAVADGMGGHGAGDRASQLAIDRLKNWWDRSMPLIVRLDERMGLLEREMAEVFRQINEELWNPPEGAASGSGTTLSVLIVIDTEYYVFHTGDTRVYLLWKDQEGRGAQPIPSSSCLQSTGNIHLKDSWTYNSLLQLSIDQTWVAEEVNRGRLGREALYTHPKRNVLTHCLGINDHVETIRTSGTWQMDELFVVCSDGFFSLFPEDRLLYEINAALERHKSLQEVSDALVHKACLLGAPDNVSLLLLRPASSGTFRGAWTKRLWNAAKSKK
ncbi:serine/threonine-protein phosphatase [Paenibacillus athensensis]|uniref:PPM-type phosphatase domain-containing protein n=1 Tax=Paenibacillus athensensis TaxID=1967502 RepID=A0A4Y8PT29_9BACL|nr:PP2C family serine/threonine-protein phosphatase [Paenibacillus athensensis]MCD1257219.1 serine/threonine-protein phosphatase [Paenibacillus athensensis]